MVLEKGAPFKTTLHSDLNDSKHALSVPVFMSFVVPDKGQEHFADLVVPSAFPILGLEIRNIEFLVSSNHKANVPLSAYLFLQLLDGQSRPTCHPFPVASCDVLKSERLSTAVILPFHGGQRIRFYLVQRNIEGNDQGENTICIRGLRLVGVVNILSGGIHNNSKAKQQIDSLSQNIFEFRLDKEREEKVLSKRQREPEVAPEGNTLVSEQPCNSPKRRAIMDDNDKGPPTLIYAFVPGGDDES